MVAYASMPHIHGSCVLLLSDSTGLEYILMGLLSVHLAISLLLRSDLRARGRREFVRVSGMERLIEAALSKTTIFSRDTSTGVQDGTGLLILDTRMIRAIILLAWHVVCGPVRTADSFAVTTLSLCLMLSLRVEVAALSASHVRARSHWL